MKSRSTMLTNEALAALQKRDSLIFHGLLLACIACLGVSALLL